MADDRQYQFEGTSHGVFGKARKFQADTWDEPEFVPLSQSEWVPDPDSDAEGRGTLFINAWLVQKNGWKE